MKDNETEMARTLYGELFAANPGLKELFAKTDFGNQRKMLIGALHYIVMNYERRGALTQTLQKMGDRHVTYGVRPEHYALFGEALLRAMARLCGTRWTREVELLWRTAYEDVAELMLRQNHLTVDDEASTPGSRLDDRVESTEARSA